MPDRAPQRVAASSVAHSLWKNLGTGRGQAVRFAQLYAQNSWLDARKLLVAQADSAIIDWCSRERRPLDQEPQAHLAVGRQRQSREVAQPAVKGGISGRYGWRVTARVVSRRAVLCPAPTTRRRWLPLQTAVAAPDRERILRDACSGWRSVRCKDCASGRIRNRVRAGEKAASRPDAASGGGSPSARRAKGSRQRLLERRQHRPRGRSGASRPLREAKQRRAAR
jgi:hypothetical protein